MKQYHKDKEEECKCPTCVASEAHGVGFIHELVAIYGKISRRELVLMSTED